MVGDVPADWSRPDPVLADAPDPAKAADAAALVELLRDLRRWAGQPSLRRLRMLGGRVTSISGHLIDALPISTTSTVLAGKRLPDLPRGEFLEAFVRACLRARAVPSEAVVQELQQWMAARHRLEATASNGNGSSAHAASVTRPIPRQLPGPPSHCTGRTGELAELTDLVQSADGDTMPIAAISGQGGVGKTWLALHWSHQNAHRFPDGQLYVNLHGFDPVDEPIPQAEVLYSFLCALGADARAVPANVDARAATYRSLVAGKRMLIVLDNARDTDHVESLLPGSPACTVLVTSRSLLCKLVTAYGARPLALQVFQDAEAWDLLDHRLGASRVATQPDAVRTVVSRCAGLPLALSIVAARASIDPFLPLATISEELTEAIHRLDALTNLRPVFSSSYHAVSPQAAEVFRLLGLVAGPDISVPAAASLTGLPVEQALRGLWELQNANLIQRAGANRFRMHDLVRLYSTELAREELTPACRIEAEHRLVDFYLHTAYACYGWFELLAEPVSIGRPVEGCTPHQVEDRASALAWIEAEYPCLLAAQDLAIQRGWDLHVWRFALAVYHFQRWRGDLYGNVVVWQAALAAAERLDEPRLRAQASLRLGPACIRLGRKDEANAHLRDALALFASADDIPGLASTHEILAAVLGMQGEDHAAKEHAVRSLELFDQLGSAHDRAGPLNSVGWFHARLGDYEQARSYCERALALYRAHLNPHGEACTLDSLAYIAMRTGEHELAVRYYRKAIALHQELGSSYDEATTLTNLGDAYFAAGRDAEAQRVWSLALAQHSRFARHEDANHVRKKIDGLAG